MTPAKTTPLTGQQKKVVDGLKAKKSPKTIAGEMNISVNGVYGHIRRLRKAGRLPAGAARKNGSTTRGRTSKPRTSRNASRNVGVRTPVITKMIAARANVEKRLASISDERAKLDAEETALKATLS